ncbi:Bcr/CflA family drug resistance efflux transporter [Photobacterium sanctipauli]|uniref:Bcr/CflA family efflux transporter n=1 Tax=Photobacterium sanctipauli TaxID=1342794 RepID=A0A2T3NSW9_9GAMM|nr:multidrug effflux MFS transporter [Photobacterium sanctipauli]PSW19384.1 Bcr/CflA family drug resistance efflux transporter [Photobacterium sanctipauli]
MNTTNNPQTGTRLVALMVTLVLFSPLAIDIYLPAMPAMADAFAVDSTRVQDTITWFMFSLGLGQLLAGPLADRFGRRPIALGGITIYALSAALAYTAETLDLLLVARFLQGFGACATSVAAFAAVRDSFGPERSGRMISYLNGAICFIPALAPLLGTWLTHQFGWRANFSFMAGFALVAGLFVMTCFRETHPQDTDVQGSMISLSRYMSVLREPTFLFHATLCMLAMAVILAYVTSAPMWLMVELGQDMNQFTVWFGINAALNILACMVAPKYIDRFGSRKTLSTGLIILLVAGVTMMLLGHIAQAWAFMVPIFMSSFGFAFVLGSAACKALAPFGDRAGTAAALLGLFQMSGAGLMVSLTQRLGLNPPSLMTLQMLLLLPGILILWSKYGLRWHAPAAAN